jgi:hypothetical protein
MSRRDTQRTALLAGALAGLAILAHVAGAGALLGCPALVLVLPLLGGRYVGEARLARLVGRLAPRRRPLAPRTSPRLPRAPRVLPRGGRLIAARLAERGPPACAAAR